MYNKINLKYSHRKTIEDITLKNFTPEQWEYCKTFFNYSCAYCGSKTKSLTKDHFVPLSKGGVFTASNILPACNCCNIAKSNKKFDSWYRTTAFYSHERVVKIHLYLKSFNKV